MTNMRIDSLIGHGNPTISFEFFPPKNDAGFQQLYKTIDELKSLHPSYVSVTYGAGGSTRQKTVELVERIQREIGIRSMAHLTCVGHTADEIGSILDDLWKAGIRNVLALRGDPPAGQSSSSRRQAASATPTNSSSSPAAGAISASASPVTPKAIRNASTASATSSTSSGRWTTARISSSPSCFSITMISIASATPPAPSASLSLSWPASCRS